MEWIPQLYLKSITNRLKSNVRNRDVINEVNNNKENETEIFFRLPYTKKISFHCNVKDKVPHEQRNNIIYRIRCPGCGGKYIGKTERCLISRMNEHGTRDTEPICKLCRNVKCFKRHVICMLFHHYIMKVT